MNWEAIRIEFEETDITMKALAEKHGVKPATLRSRKTREDWQRNATNKVATKRATKRKKVATKKVITEQEDNKKLNDKQKLFCRHYSQNHNATKSYKEAYGVSQKVAEANAYRMMENDGVREEIKRIKMARSRDWLITDEDIVEEWIRMAFPDVNDYLEYEGDDVFLKPAEEVDGRVIQEIKISKFGTTVKLYDKQKALIELQKLLQSTDKLNNDFTKKRIQKLEEEIKLIKGKEPDTSLMKLLLNTVGEDNGD